jgi:uncharacterized delta-60 repeat protein
VSAGRGNTIVDVDVERALRVAVVLACVAIGVWAGPAMAAAGDLDRTFAGDGKLTSRFGDMRALAIQRDGRIVVAGVRVVGTRWMFALARHLPNGRPDRSFGGNGRLTTRFRARDCVGVDALAVQGDGRIVAAGRAGCTGGRFAVARYLPSGRLDRSFSGDGKLTTRFGARCRFSEARAVAIQRNGRIVTAGQAGCGRAARLRVTFALARYTRAGRLDRSFAGDGRLTTDFTSLFDSAFDVVIQPDRKLVAAGTAGTDSDGAQFALARYTPAGRLDPSFGGDGKVTNLFTGEQDCTPAEAYALARQRDGKLVAAGLTGCGHPNFAIARYVTDGSLDRAFGGDGKVATIFAQDNCSDLVKDVAIQADGKVLAAGVAGCRDPHPEFALARYDASGVLDRSFGGDGEVTTHIGTSGECFDQLNAVALQRDGRIVAAGSAACGPHSGYAVLRYRGG